MAIERIRCFMCLSFSSACWADSNRLLAFTVNGASNWYRIRINLRAMARRAAPADTNLGQAWRSLGRLLHPSYGRTG